MARFDEAERLLAVGPGADDVYLVEQAEQRDEACADRRLVIGDDDAGDPDGCEIATPTA